MGNDYLEGNYAPVRREHTVIELAVTGTAPGPNAGGMNPSGAGGTAL
jgi:hypothetical protein